MLFPPKVRLSASHVQALAKQWPCSGLPYAALDVAFDCDGNLVDLQWITRNRQTLEGIDGAAERALSYDALAIAVEKWPDRFTDIGRMTAAEYANYPCPHSR